MKSIIKEGNISDKGFPKLMINESFEGNFIVLFTQKYYGIVINSKNSNYPLATTGSSWSMSNFKDFNGTIELSNS